MLVYLIPSAISYCRVCDGDARVIVMFSLRKLIPYLASQYYNSRELRTLFVDKVLLQLPVGPLLHDQSPVPQYMVRLLSEICSASDECCQDLTRCFINKHTNTHENLIEPLFQLLDGKTSDKASDTPSKANPDSQSDPQVIILLRQLLSSMSSEFFAILMRSDICSVLSRSVLMSVRSFNCEHLLVDLEFLQTLFTISRDELQRNTKDQHPPITTSSILSSLEANFQAIILPLIGVLQWNATDPSQERAFVNIDPSMMVLVHDCTLKSLLLLIDLIPDGVVESLLYDKLSTGRISRIFLNDQVFSQSIRFFSFLPSGIFDYFRNY